MKSRRISDFAFLGTDLILLESQGRRRQDFSKPLSRSEKASTRYAMACNANKNHVFVKEGFLNVENNT